MSGLLAKAATTAGSKVYATVPAAVPYASVNIVIANPLTTDQTASVSIGTGTSAAAADLVCPDTVIPTKGTLEISCRICSGGEKIFVNAQSAGLVVRVETIDEET